MLDTLGAMTVPILVLLIIGFVTLGLAWWAAIVTEGKDEWLTGSEDE
jgi:hypothetical protein